MKCYQPGPYYQRYWDGLRSVGKQPFTVRRYRYSTQVVDASGKLVTHLCLRGNSKQRRQQVRLDPRNGQPFYRRPTGLHMAINVDPQPEAHYTEVNEDAKAHLH